MVKSPLQSRSSSQAEENPAQWTTTRMGRVCSWTHPLSHRGHPTHRMDRKWQQNHFSAAFDPNCHIGRHLREAAPWPSSRSSVPHCRSPPSALRKSACGYPGLWRSSTNTLRCHAGARGHRPSRSSGRRRSGAPSRGVPAGQTRAPQLIAAGLLR